MMTGNRADPPEEPLPGGFEGEGLSAAERLAAEYLDRVSRGERPPREGWLGRLPDQAARAEFTALLDQAMSVDQLLPAVLEPGEYVGRYRLEEELPAGGMGRVFRATMDDPPLPVALKILPPHHGGPRFQERFRREARFLAQMQHPNVVRIHDAGSNQDLHYLIMEYVDGPSMSEVLERLEDRRPSELSGEDLRAAIGRPVPAGEDDLLEQSWYRSVARIMVQVVRGIEAAHGSGILHRDLKPSNLLIKGGGNPVVVDFGLATSWTTDEASIGDGLAGTAPYLPPELFRKGGPGADRRTDVYQLGLLLYEFLTLRRAFEGSSVAEVTMAIQQGQMPWPRVHNPGVPPELEAIVLKATEPDPARRYETATQMREDLESVLLGETPRNARIPSVLRRVQLRLRPYRGRLAAAAMVLVAVLGTWSWLQEPRAGRALGMVLREGRIEQLSAMDELRVGDKLGLTLVLDEPAVVYVMSLMSLGEGGGQYVLPVPTYTERDVQEGRTVRELSRALPRGTHQLLACEVERIGDAPWSEGLMVFLGDAEQPWMTRWLEKIREELDQFGPDGPVHGLSLAAAKRRLTNILALSRGGDLDSKGLQKEVEDLPTWEPEEKLTWPFEDPTYQVLRYTVNLGRR